ncbi:hypothetical protein GF362_04960 [Candidatus Dojkabacteria bacterium]|nr:hypothetical protein [Candidatus Dojkabacteria bacterium]
MPARIHKAKQFFATLNVDDHLVDNAVKNLKYWLLHPDFENYQDQINYLIESEQFEELFDCFFQVIPFGTGGRRGRVGIGPNRINPWTIAASAQGHTQYLLEQYGDEAKKRGIVIAYDVRQYTKQDIYNPDLHNPIWGITSCDLAEIAATVYSKNGLNVYFFDQIAPTPLLSFTIRKLNAISGINISASHNPPDYNGKKVYNRTGGQLIPPFDQKLANEVNHNVDIFDVEWGIFNEEVKKENIQIIDPKIEDYYISKVSQISRSKNRVSRILYSPLHGTGKRNIYKSMKRLNFDIHLDPLSSIPSGEFETVPNNIANPELPIVYERLKLYANEIKANLILTSDPDADRMGITARSNNKWNFIDGNQTVILLVNYLLNNLKALGQLSNKHIILATLPVTRLIERIADNFQIKLKNTLLPGFKYISNEIDLIEKRGEIDNLIIAVEDTLGHLAGNYARDKDGTVGSILLSEYEGELEKKNSNLIKELDNIYQKYGYFKNIIEYILFEHSFKKGVIDKIMNDLRARRENLANGLTITKFQDYWELSKILSATDKSSKNILEYELKQTQDYKSGRILIRPSGTEPKLKIYIELASEKEPENLEKIKETIDNTAAKIIDNIKKSLKM